MSVRDVLVRFRATVDGFTTPVDKAKASVEQLRESTEKTQAWDKLSTGAVVAGAAITAGLGFAVKAAMEWESAWTGVLKTVDASPAQFEQLEGQLKELARTLPASAEEIANVAENAGQLGVKAADIATFTKTMIDLGEATNLTADEASTAIAQIANVMGTGGQDIERFGAALVALGNNGASTEKDIVMMAQRIAASGKLVGLSETDVLAYSSALASVGIEAEAGGTAISQSFTQIGDAVDRGGQKLTTIARTAGMTSAQFKAAFEQDAAGAMQKFVVGLAAVEEQGGSASRVLDSLGMSGIRQKNALLSLATSGDLLSNSLKTATLAWSENTALANEAARRYETTESRMKMAANTATQAAASIGEALLPALAGLADGTAKVTAAFTGLPGPFKAVIAYGAAFAGVGLLAVGGAMKLASGLVELKGNVTTLANAFPGLQAKMERVDWKGAAIAAGMAVAVFYTAVYAMSKLSAEAEKLTLTTEGVQAGLSSLGKEGVGLAPMELQIAKLSEALNTASGAAGTTKFSIGDVATYMDKVVRATNDWGQGMARTVDGWFGVRTNTGLILEDVRKIDTGLANLAANGGIGEAQTAFATLAAEAAKSGHSVEALVPIFGTYANTLAVTAGQIGINNLSTAELAQWMGGVLPERIAAAAAANPQLVAALSESQQAALNVSSAADSASKALQAQAEATRSAAMANIEASGSMVGWHAMLAETASKLGKVTVSTNKARTAINLNTKAGRDNQSTLDRIASTALNTAAALEKTGDGAGNAAKVIARSRAAFIDAATKMGLTKAAARELADSYGLLPEKKGTKVEEKGSKESKKQVDALTKAVKDLPKDVQTKVLSTFKRDGIDAALDALRKIDGKTVKTYIDTIHRDKGNGPGRAFGGWIDGPGSWTSDSILTPLSRDEFVIRASRATAIERVHPGFLSMLNDPSAPLTFGRGLAEGGYPGPTVTYAAPERYSVLGGAAPVIVQEGPRLTIGSLVFEPESGEELAVFTAFMQMAARKAAVGL